MAFSFDFSHLSSFANAQHFAVAVCAPPQALKARPLGLVIDSIDSNVVAPDIDCRSISSLSDDCSQSSQSDDDTPSSTIVGFGRKRHSVLPTLPPFPDSNERSTIVGFGRKPHPNRQSIAAAPHALAAAAPSSVTAERKRENRRSLPNPIIPREPIDAKHLRRVSLDLGIKHTPNLVAGTNTRRASILGTARKVSDTILGNTSRQPPKPLLLPQQVQARNSLPARVKQCLVAKVVSAASSPRVKELVGRFSAARELRLKPLNVGRQSKEETSKQDDVDSTRSLIEFLVALLYLRLRAILGF